MRDYCQQQGLPAFPSLPLLRQSFWALPHPPPSSRDSQERVSASGPRQNLSTSQSSFEAGVKRRSVAASLDPDVTGPWLLQGLLR